HLRCSSVQSSGSLEHSATDGCRHGTTGGTATHAAAVFHQHSHGHITGEGDVPGVRWGALGTVFGSAGLGGDIRAGVSGGGAFRGLHQLGDLLGDVLVDTTGGIRIVGGQFAEVLTGHPG